MIRAGIRGLVAALVAFALFPAVAHAEWRRAESEHFVIYSDRSEASVREYAALLEDFDALLRSRHRGVDEGETPRKLDVYLVGTVSQLRRVWPTAPDRVGGFYSASSSDIYAVAIRDAAGIYDKTLGDDVVMHEYVHHFMKQYHKASYPPWLIEGYAEYYATTDLSPKKITIGHVSEGRARAITSPGWLAMDAVLTKRVSELSTSDKGAFYAQSWLLTHYILSDNGRRAKLNVYLREWRKTGDSVAAWKAAFGETPKELKASLDRYRSRPLMGLVITRTPSPKPSMTVSTLSRGADDVLLESLQLKRPVAKNRQADLLQRMRTVHARLPADRFARIAAARAETRFGDRDAGDALLRKMIAEDASDHEAMAVLAESHIARGRVDRALRNEHFANARKLLASAVRLQPNDYRLYILSAQTRLMDPGPPSENTLNVLTKAVQLAPQVYDLRMMAAVIFLRTKDAEEEVRHLLEPLLTDPHGGALTTRAQSMIAALDKAQAAGAPPPTPASQDEDGGEEADES